MSKSKLALDGELSQSAFLRGLIENANVGVVVFDVASETMPVVFANARALEVLERPSADGLLCVDLCPSEQKSGEPKRPIASFCPDFMNREGHHSELLIQKSNKISFVASAAIKRLEVAGKKFVLLSFQDITVQWKLSRDLKVKQEEITRAYAELLEQNSQLKLLDQAKDKFIALTTHELRTPLSAILATADFLENKLYESDEQRDEFIRTIGEQGRHLLELVNDVLDFAKIRAGKMEFFVEQVEIGSLLKKVAGNFQHMAEQSDIKIQFVAPEASHRAWADLIRLKEIINNVVSNAIKYNRKSGTVTISVSNIEHEDRGFVRISVRDTGVGIPEDKIEGVFNEFETVGHVSRHHKGTGLGMPISRRLVESMGGRLTLTSEVGVGSEFHIDIPLEKVLEESFYRTRPGMDDDLMAS